MSCRKVERAWGPSYWGRGWLRTWWFGVASGAWDGVGRGNGKHEHGKGESVKDNSRKSKSAIYKMYTWIGCF